MNRKLPWRHTSAAWMALAMFAAGPGSAAGQPTTLPSAEAASSPAVTLSAPMAPPRAWMAVPRIAGRLTRQDIGLVINTADPYSVKVGAYYARARRLAPEQILRVSLPLRPTLEPEEFHQLEARIARRFGPATQALALAWTMPYAVGCNSITGALALGYDPGLCSNSCAPSRRSSYFNSTSSRPYTDFGERLSMLLAAPDVAAARALIDRGVSADQTLGLRGALPAGAWFVATSDGARSVRSRLFPPAGLVSSVGVDVHVARGDVPDEADRVLLYLTGAVRVEQLDRLHWLPGALADHLTSFGGALDGTLGQMTALSWIGAGATASYGTTSEPCSHLQKFPHPQVLLLNYVQGATAIEAYWKSVAWPQQGLFIGEPLAAPFARR